MQVCFFEDDLYTRFHPLTLTRPVDDLRLGIFTIAEKWRQVLSNYNFNRTVRSELIGIFSNLTTAQHPTLWINSRFLPSESLVDKIKNLEPGTCIKQDDTIVAAHADAGTTRNWLKKGQPDVQSLLVLEGQHFQCISRLWDLFLLNEQEIIADINLIENFPSVNGTVSSHAILENEAQIFVGSGATIEPGAILMANNGPIYIGEGATVMAGAKIQGPAVIGEHSKVKMDAKIYHGTTIGPVCKVGGEIHNSIFHSYSNKGHDGYVGNSLFGQWCNLGADTNTSNLKNNYSEIHITDWQSGDQINTGQQFLGTVMGDHTKTAINTQLNTGTLCGVSCNIFSSDFPPKLIPSFSWVGTNVIQPYKFDKALKTMKTMMNRRNISLSDSYIRLMKHLSER